MAPSSQPELFPRTKAPRIAGDEISLLIRVLAGRGWMTGQEIGGTPEFTPLFERSKRANIERKIRAIANASNGHVISYPGSPGYRLTREATIAEIQTATAVLRHQGGEMIQRALQIDRVYHGKLP